MGKLRLRLCSCAPSAEGDRAYLREERVINTCLFTERQIHTSIQNMTGTLFTGIFLPLGFTSPIASIDHDIDYFPRTQFDIRLVLCS